MGDGRTSRASFTSSSIEGGESLSTATGRPLGSERARQIVEECYADVLEYCRRHAPAGHDAEDLAQETFLRLVRSGAYDTACKPIAYLMRTARNVCIDASREKHLETVSLDFDVAADDCPDEAAGIEEALSRLPDDLREVVEMRFGADLEVGDVARALGLSRFSVRRRLRRALAILKEELWEGGQDA